MLYVVRHGPVRTPEGPQLGFVVYRLGPGSAPRQVLGFVAGSDEAGLELIARAFPEPITCSPELAELGAEFWFKSIPIPVELRRPVALDAWFSRLDGLAPRVSNDVASVFCEAAAEFSRAAPWRTWGPRVAIDVSINGATTRRSEATLGNLRDASYGIMLYDEPGDAQRTEDCLARRDIHGILSIGRLLVKFRSTCADRALSAGFGSMETPFPGRLDAGTMLPIGAEELLALAATMRAAAGLSRTSAESTASVSADGAVTTVTLSAPPPNRRAEGDSSPDGDSSQEEDEMVREWLAIRARVSPEEEESAPSIGREPDELIYAFWDHMELAGFAVGAVVDGRPSWRDTDRGERLSDALAKRGLLRWVPGT